VTGTLLKKQLPAYIILMEGVAMDKEEILKMCESILRDIHECDKVYLHVDRIKSIINRRVQPCEFCLLTENNMKKPFALKFAVYCDYCGRKLEVPE
jgi:hypothetical protein